MRMSLDKIDLPMLKEQKMALLELIWDDEENILWGIVNMLDDIQDALDPP